MRGPLSLKPDAGQECAEGGAVGRRRPRRVLGCEHERGAMADGDGEFHQEAAPLRALHASSRAGAPPIVMAWSVCGAEHECPAREARMVVVV